MVQFINRLPSFGEEFARNFGGGVSQGIGAGLQHAMQLNQIQAKEAAKRREKMALLSEVFGVSPKSLGSKLIPDQKKTIPEQLGHSQDSQEKENQFIDLVQKIESSGVELNPQDLDQLWNEFDQMSQQSSIGQKEDPFAKAKMAEIIGEHGLAQIFSEEAKHEREMSDLPKKEYLKGEYKNLPKFMEKLLATEEKLPITDLSIKLAEEAIEDPSKAASFRDRFADLTGLEAFRSAKGAELQSAIKQYFLSDLASIKGGRPNQLIEQQLLDAYPKIGRDPISNQKILVGMKMSQAIDQEKVKISRELEELELSKHGYLSPGFEHRVRQKLRPFAEKIEKDAVKKLDGLAKFQKQYEKFAKQELRQGEILMLTPDGTGYEAVHKNDFSKAKEQGYIKLK